MRKLIMVVFVISFVSLPSWAHIANSNTILIFNDGGPSKSQLIDQVDELVDALTDCSGIPGALDLAIEGGQLLEDLYNPKKKFKCVAKKVASWVGRTLVFLGKQLNPGTKVLKAIKIAKKLSELVLGWLLNWPFISEGEEECNLEYKSFKENSIYYELPVDGQANELRLQVA